MKIAPGMCDPHPCIWSTYFRGFWTPPTQAEEIILLVEEQELSQQEGDIAELNVLTAAAMLKEAERLEDAAREAGAFPKGW